MPTSKIPELEAQLDALLHTLDHALTELSEARGSKSIQAIAAAAGRVHNVTGKIEQVTSRLVTAIRWEAT
jgi:hypothetical protein